MTLVAHVRDDMNIIQRAVLSRTGRHLPADQTAHLELEMNQDHAVGPSYYAAEEYEVSLKLYSKFCKSMRDDRDAISLCLQEMNRMVYGDFLQALVHIEHRLRRLDNRESITRDVADLRKKIQEIDVNVIS